MSGALHGGVGTVSSMALLSKAHLPSHLPPMKKGEEFNTELRANATAKLQFKKELKKGKLGAVLAAAVVRPCCSDPGGFPCARAR